MSLTKKEIQFATGTYTNKDGVEVKTVIVNHHVHGEHSLLHKYKPGTEERMNIDEMKTLMKSMPNWRDNIQFVADGKYGAYYTLSMMIVEYDDEM